MLFALGNQMYQRQTVEEGPGDMSGANSFRACIGCLVRPLLAAERVEGLLMIVCIKPT
jgi:hypothetical protein